MNTAKMTFGGLLAAAVVGALAVAPADAGTFVWVSDGPSDFYYASSPSYSSYSYATYSPSYSSSYSRVSYRSTYTTTHVPSYYSVSYTSTSPSYYSRSYSYRSYTVSPSFGSGDYTEIVHTGPDVTIINIDD